MITNNESAAIRILRNATVPNTNNTNNDNTHNINIDTTTKHYKQQHHTTPTSHKYQRKYTREHYHQMATTNNQQRHYTHQYHKHSINHHNE